MYFCFTLVVASVAGELMRIIRLVLAAEPSEHSGD